MNRLNVRSNHQWLPKIVVALLAYCSMSLLSLSAHGASANLCNKSPFPLFIAYAYISQESAKWETVGWYRTLPGTCTTTMQSDAEYVYYYADAQSSDIVAKHLDRANSAWTGSDEEHSATLCVSSSAFHHFSDDCKTSERSEVFARIKNDTTMNLTCGGCGVDIDSLEEASTAYRRLQGQIRYGKSIADDPKGIPFRVGVEVEDDSHSPFVTKVYSGLPAEQILRPGDRIMMIDGQPVKSIFDLVFLLQEFGYKTNPSTREVSIGFARYDPMPTYYETMLPVLYYRSLDDNINVSEAKAAAIGLMDGVVFNTSPYLRCIGRFFSDEFKEVPEHHRQKDCVERLRSERARASELHKSMAIYDFVGSLTSPRLLLKLGSKSAARHTVRRVGIAMADEAVQGAISEVAWAGGIKQVQAPSLMKTMAIGAVAGGVVGFIAK